MGTHPTFICRSIFKASRSLQNRKTKPANLFCRPCIYKLYSILSNPQLYGIPVCRKRIELTLRGFRRLQLCILGKNPVNYEDALVKLRLQSLDKRREAMSLKFA